MPVVLIRVRLPDRAGALGQVASRIGALGGDIAEVEILEHGAGGAVDEFLVDLPAGVPLGLIESELAQVDGVAVENVALREMTRRRSSLETAVAIAQSSDTDTMWRELARHARSQVGCDWAAVVDAVTGSVLHANGDLPPVAWLLMFAEASEDIETGDEPLDGRNGALCVPIAATSLVLLAGRLAIGFRQRETAELAALADIAAACRARVSAASSVAVHPSRLATRGRFAG